MEAQNENDLIERGKVLITALADYGMPMSEAAWNYTGADAPKNDHVKPEVRALHRATVAFSQALNATSNMVEKINTTLETVDVPVTPTPAMLTRMVDAWDDAHDLALGLKLPDTVAMECVWDAAIAAAKGGAA